MGRQFGEFRHPSALTHATDRQSDRAQHLLAICAVLSNRGHLVCSGSRGADIFRHAPDGQSSVCIRDTALLAVEDP